MAAEWGFDFVRLPLSYHCWSNPKNWRELRETALKEIDEAIEFGLRYRIHVCLNFHRAPGYSVSKWIPEPFNLWTDSEALEACRYHWSHFAARYKDISNRHLSFNLVNEPGAVAGSTLVDDATYYRVIRSLAEGIRSESPERLLIADGLYWGRVPCPLLSTLGIAQSSRGYEPMELSHWKAPWVQEAAAWPLPSWPLPVTSEIEERGRRALARIKSAFARNYIVANALPESLSQEEWDRERIDLQLIQPWKMLEAQGVGIHIGEFGAHNLTPHGTALRWMGTLLAGWKNAGWGWALWNLRGTFGVLDSHRADVSYENFRGHQLDRKMLELLRSS